MTSYRPLNLRSVLDAPVGPLRTDASKTLILARASGEVSFAKTVGDKDAMLRQFDAGADLLMLAWTGKYTTDIFVLTPADLARHYRPEAA
jgi:hypothetical protein